MLPRDILEAIFWECVSWLYWPKRLQHRLAWTQVCRYWRSISLESTRLWRTIDVGGGTMAAELLRRSKTAPVWLCSAWPVGVCDDEQDFARHAARIEAIDVELFPHDLHRFLTNIGPVLPALTRLALRVPPPSTPIAFDIALPALRNLTLRSVVGPWDNLQGLTRLTLHRLGPHAPSVGQIHGIFSRSPYLEYVDIDSVGPIAHVYSTVLTLAHLHQLVLAAPVPVIIAILSRVSIPTTRLQLTCPSLTQHDLFVQLSSVSLITTRGIRLSCRAFFFLSLNAQPWSDHLHHCHLALNSPSHIAFHFLPFLPAALDLSHIAFLEFNPGVLHCFDFLSLKTFFIQTHRVHTLRIAVNTLRDLLILLIRPQKNILLPHLTCISFGRSGDPWWHFTNHWLPSILHCVKTRKALGVPLKTLEFVKCHGITISALQELQPFVPNLAIVAQLDSRHRSSCHPLFTGLF